MRIGAALSDPEGILATPLITIDNNRKTVFKIKELLEEHSVNKVIVGYPLNLKGIKGVMAAEVDVFIDKLKELDIDIVRWDERFSSYTADSLLKQAGVKSSRDKGRIDRSAAAIILQSYLDHIKLRRTT